MKHRTGFDDIIIYFIDKYLDVIIFVFLFLISLHIRIKYTPLVALPGWSDYSTFLKPWVEEYAKLGIVKGLSTEVGDYYIPYNIILAVISTTGATPVYGISFISCLFDYVIAIALYLIMRELRKCSPALLMLPAKYDKCLALAIINLPFVIVDSAIWKQCDSIYSAFILLALYFFIKERPNLTFIMIGLAFSFKFQTIFVVPFFILMYYLKRNFSLLHVLWVPGIYLLTGLPAILCGRSITNTYGTYYRQMMSTGGETVVSFPGIWFIGFQEKMFRHIAILVTMLIFIAAVIFAQQYLKKKSIDTVSLLYFAAWCIMTSVEFLPGMHERYDYLAVLLISFLAITGKKSLIIPAIVMNLCSNFSYARLLTQTNEQFYPLAALFYFAAYCFITFDLCKSLPVHKESKK